MVAPEGRKAEAERKVEPEPKAAQAARAFAGKLRWHMDNGTREAGLQQPWTAEALGDACGVSARSVRNWLSGTYLPPDIQTLEGQFFGISDQHVAWRTEFRALWATARQDRPPTVRSTTEAESTPDVGRPPIEPPPLCLGRDTQTALLLAALTGPTDTTAIVLGPAGIGKTTLTRQVAAHPDLIPRFGPRRWFAELETARDAPSLRQRIVLAIGQDPANPAAFDLACQSLGTAPALLVLDNLETPWESDMARTEADLCRLAAIPGLSLLVSVRGTAAPGGPVFTPHLILTPLNDADATSLFRRHAPNIAATDPHLAAFLAALGGIPLAIELVSRRAARQPGDLTELWDQYRVRGLELARHPHLPEGRLTSVVRSLDLSWQSPRLHNPGRRLFRLLGCSPAGLSRADREALCGTEALEAAEQVTEVGLAVPRDGRLDLLPPVRGYALAMQQPAAAEADDWCHHFLALSKALGDVAGKDGSGALIERLSPEVANLEAALTSAAEGERRTEGVAAGFGYHVVARSTGLGRPAPLLVLAASCHAAEDPGLAARCLEWVGDIALARSDHDEARARYDESRPLFRRVGDVIGEAKCIQSLGDIALRRSDHDEARARYDEARPLYHRVGAVLGEASCIQGLGDIALRRSDHAEARARYDEARPLFHRIGNVLGEANCIHSLGNIALQRADHAEARALYDEARPLYRRVGDVLGDANCIHSLGNIALERSDHDEARARYDDARLLYRRVGDVLGEANCIQSLGDIALQRSDRDAARLAWIEALDLYARIRQPYSIGGIHRRLATISEGAGQADHIAAARAAWESIERSDLVARYLEPLR